MGSGCKALGRPDGLWTPVAPWLPNPGSMCF